MLHHIHAGMPFRSLPLEQIDAADRTGGTPQARRLGQMCPKQGNWRPLWLRMHHWELSSRSGQVPDTRPCGLPLPAE